MASVPLRAIPLTWTLHNVTFNDGGTASGTYVYDADTNTVSNINIVTTAGSAMPGATYTNLSSGAQAYSFNVTVVPHGFLGYLTSWPNGYQRLLRTVVP